MAKYQVDVSFMGPVTPLFNLFFYSEVPECDLLAVLFAGITESFLVAFKAYFSLFSPQ